MEADVTDATQAADACARTVDTFGSLDAVVNLAGSLYLKPAHRTPPEDFEKVIRTNLISAFNAVRAAVGHMPKGGSIVLVSTVAAQLGLPNHEAIAAAKAGVEGLTRAAAASYATKGIRVNAVAPSLTDTPLTAALTGHEATLKASTAMHPLGRIGTAQDIASAIAWLLDPSTNWVTGQVIPVDGGLSTLRVR
jgi:NAD(P)-dependent dehydrogenase (short-subunit alcohol dehydrogenase family)